jgi:hypothetical protein
MCIVDSIILMACGETELERRLLERSKTSGRSDDNPSTIKKRFKTFVETTMPVIVSMQPTGLIRRVVAEETIPNVFHEMCLVYEDVSKKEIIRLTELLLHCVQDNKWDLYNQLSDSQATVLTHDGWSTPLPPHNSLLCQPTVHFFGKSAAISYKRLIIQSASGTEFVAETRVWQLIDKKWIQRHLQRF